MMVVLCDSWEEAKYSYEIFLDFLKKHDPFNMRKTYDYCLCVYLESFLLCPPLPRTHYIFVPYQVQNYPSLRFDVSKNDISDCGSFFDELYEIEDMMFWKDGLQFCD